MQTVIQTERVFLVSLPLPTQLTMSHPPSWLLQLLTQILNQKPNTPTRSLILNQKRNILNRIVTRSPVMLLMSLVLDLLKISDCTAGIRRN